MHCKACSVVRWGHGTVPTSGMQPPPRALLDQLLQRGVAALAPEQEVPLRVSQHLEHLVAGTSHGRPRRHQRSCPLAAPGKGPRGATWCQVGGEINVEP